MSYYQPRDKSGPMEVDDHDPYARIAAFSISDPGEGPSRKRPHTDLSTPIRQFQTPSRPLMVSPNTPFLFNCPAAPLPSSSSFSFSQPYDPNQFTPARLGFDAARSSAPDVEMSTDSPSRDVIVPAPSTEGPNEAALAKAEERPVAKGAVKRVERRRREGWKKERDATTGGDAAAKMEHTYNLHMPAPALRHSEIPQILLGYLQVLVNVSVVLFVIYLAAQFVLAVRRDVKDRMAEYSVEIMHEIAECSHLYLTNRCDPQYRVPAMEAPCKAWEACMSRDPTKVGRTNVIAETFAGVINSFVEPISWKTMGFTLVTLSFVLSITNSAFFNIRAARRDASAVAPPQTQWLQPQHPALQHFAPPTKPAHQQPQLIDWEGKRSRKWLFG